MTMSNSSTETPVTVEVLKPKQLLEGISPEDIKALPKVRALLNAIIDAEKEKAHSEGYKDGFEKGKSVAYDEAKQAYESEFKVLLEHHEADIENVVNSLRKPVSELPVAVVEKLKKRFDDVIRVVVKDVSIYDESISDSLQAILKSLPENNKLIKIKLSSKLPETFKAHFEKFGAEVNFVEMDDLIRLELSNEKLRFSVDEYAERILKTNVQ